MRVTVDARARTDTERAVRFYRQKSTRVALAFVDEVEAAIKRIAPSPRRFALVEDAPDGCEVREVYIDRFQQRVLFRILGDEVIVFAVVHASAGPQLWLPRVTDDTPE